MSAFLECFNAFLGDFSQFSEHLFVECCWAYSIYTFATISNLTIGYKIFILEYCAKSLLLSFSNFIYHRKVSKIMLTKETICKISYFEIENKKKIPGALKFGEKILDHATVHLWFKHSEHFYRLFPSTDKYAILKGHNKLACLVQSLYNRHVTCYRIFHKKPTLWINALQRE